MRPFTPEIELMIQWKEKLSAISTKRSALKKELLNLLNLSALDKENSTHSAYKTRYEAFNRRREELLQENHAQGWVWIPHFTFIRKWFWRSLSWLPFSWAKKSHTSGSKIREALTNEMTRSTSVLFTGMEQIGNDTLDDSEFEKALFDAPNQALNDLVRRITKLNQTSNASEKRQAIERVNAIKFRLSPKIYREYLNQLFIKAPKESLVFFYKIYQQEHRGYPKNSYQFIEHHLMARNLLDYFVLKTLPITEEKNLDSILYNIHYLALFLNTATLHSIDPINDPIEALLSSDKPPLNAIDTIYRGGEDSVFNQLTERLPHNDQGYAIPLTIIKAIHEGNRTWKDPLFIHFIRLACESLMLSYTKRGVSNHSWDGGRLAPETLLFFAKILNNNNSVTIKNHNLADSQFLDPNQTKPFFPNPYCHSEKLAVDIIIGCYYSNGIQTALKLYKTYFSNNPITPMELDWILGRVSYYYPQLVEPLHYVLTQTHLINKNDLSVSDYLDTKTLSPNEVIKMIQEKINLAETIESELTANAQKEAHAAYQEVVFLFYQLIETGNITKDQAKILTALFTPSIQNHITDSEQTYFENKLKALCADTVDSYLHVDSSPKYSGKSYGGLTHRRDHFSLFARKSTNPCSQFPKDTIPMLSQFDND